jgi:hypothetical protein
MDKGYLRQLKYGNRRNVAIREVTSDGDRTGETFLEETGNGDLADKALANSIFDVIDSEYMEKFEENS